MDAYDNDKDTDGDGDGDGDTDGDGDGDRTGKLGTSVAKGLPLSYKMDDVAMARRLEAVASAFTRKVDEKRDRCRALFDVEYSIKCLPVSCA
jgi:hypothetical protein